MCGIVGFTGSTQAAPVLIEGLRRLEYRGYDSAGVAVHDGERIEMVKASGSVAHLAELTENGNALRGVCGIAHTRWATHGAPTDTNAHPHLSEHGLFAVIHNGIIENFAALRSELEAEGYVFASETDTEVVAHLLEKYYDGDLKRTVMRTASRLEGSYVLGVLCAAEPGRLFCVKEAGPSSRPRRRGELLRQRRHRPGQPDEERHIHGRRRVCRADARADNRLRPHRPEITKTVSHVVWDIEAAEKGGYEHFMMKEIMEQPRAVKNTVEPRIRGGRIVFEDFALTREELESYNRIVITACGSAYHAGVVGKYVIESLCRVSVECALASELRYSDPIIDSHTLLIVISQSGETADTIAAMRECMARGARSLAIVNVVGSTIARLADSVIYTHAGPEIAVATTKGYTTQLAALYLFAVWAAELLGKIDAERYSHLVESIRSLPRMVQRAIDLNVHVKYLSERWHQLQSLFFIGRNIDYAAAMEGSLKLKEISYIHSEAYAAGELKHGTIALIDEKRLVVALCCQDALFDKMVSNIQEVKARGAKVLGVAPEGNRRIFAEADDVLYSPKCEPLFAALPEIVPLQLFAYHIARENGCDIDKPRNLAKSVTVE